MAWVGTLPARKAEPRLVEHPQQWIEPHRAEETPRLPVGPRWLYEIKFDGFRVQMHKRGKRVVIYSKNGHDYTAHYGSLAEALSALPVERVILDAEAVVPTAEGRTDFWALAKAVAQKQSAAIVAQVFDVLFLDGCDLRELPLVARKARLGDLLKTDKSHQLQFSAPLTTAEPMEFARALNLEGVIAKVADSPYRSGRTHTWQKTVCQYRETLPVIGYAIKDGKFDGLYLAKRDGNSLIYGGKVEGGFDDGLAKALPEQLQALTVARCVLDQPPEKRKARWIEPRVCVNIVHRGGLTLSKVRHARFEGFAEATKRKVTAPKIRRAPAPAPSPDAVKPENILQLLPDAVVPTTEQLKAHWRRHGKRALAYLGSRPLKFVRHAGETTYYHKGPLPPVHPDVHQLHIRKADGTPGIRLWVDSVAGLVGLADMGIVELHPWSATVDDIEHPDTMVFDLDPGERITWSFVRDTALKLRDILAAEGFDSWPKLTGGKGLHLVAPLEPVLSHRQVHAYTQAIARQLAATDPSRYTMEPGEERRVGKLFIDYLRNGRGCTAVGAYSPRARSGWRVAVPVAWKDIQRSTRPKEPAIEVR